mgnify:CR=1 FL=1
MRGQYGTPGNRLRCARNRAVYTLAESLAHGGDLALHPSAGSAPVRTTAAVAGKTCGRRNGCPSQKKTALPQVGMAMPTVPDQRFGLFGLIVTPTLACVQYFRDRPLELFLWCE